ncbi:MAG: M23 family metallopeptidase [Aquificaceae bacterium]
MRYRYRIEERRGRRLAFVKFIRRLALLALIAIVFYTLFLLFGGRPQLSEEWLKSLSLLPFEESYKLSFSRPVKEIKLYVEEEGKRREIYRYLLQQPSKEVELTLKPKDLGLRDGEVNLLFEVSSGFLSKRTYPIKALVDTLPPRVDLVAYTSFPMLGGTSAIKVKVEEEAQVYVIQGDHRYPLYPLDKGYHFGLFPIKLDGDAFGLMVVDKVGNSQSQPLNLRIKIPRFRVDRIYIDKGFIDKAIYPLLGDEGEGLPPLEAFKRINEMWRSRDMKRIEEIGRRSEPRILWEGAFLQLPKSKVFATYGDIRYYYYQGQKVSESRHMGFDFASVEGAPVPAANSGVVVFAGYLGIYGNTVIVDHGMGLMSLYGHLSEVLVKEGQFVKRGELVGRTGDTGFALGDHLHFGMVLHGYEVNPIEWFDPKWIKDNLKAVLDAR